MGWVLFIAAGGIGVPTAVFLLARALVYRHADRYANDAIHLTEVRGHVPGVLELKFENAEYEYEIEVEVGATR